MEHLLKKFRQWRNTHTHTHTHTHSEAKTVDVMYVALVVQEHPYYDPDEEENPAATGMYRYRVFTLPPRDSNDIPDVPQAIRDREIKVLVRTEVQVRIAVPAGPGTWCEFDLSYICCHLFSAFHHFPRLNILHSAIHIQAMQSDGSLCAIRCLNEYDPKLGMNFRQGAEAQVLPLLTVTPSVVGSQVTSSVSSQSVDKHHNPIP